MVSRLCHAWDSGDAQVWRSEQAPECQTFGEQPVKMWTLNECSTPLVRSSNKQLHEQLRHARLVDAIQTRPKSRHHHSNPNPTPKITANQHHSPCWILLTRLINFRKDGKHFLQQSFRNWNSNLLQNLHPSQTRNWLLLKTITPKTTVNQQHQALLGACGLKGNGMDWGEK